MMMMIHVISFFQQDIGVGHLCDGLFEQNLDRGLKTLVLWNNQITYHAMAHLNRALVSLIIFFFRLKKSKDAHIILLWYFSPGSLCTARNNNFIELEYFFFQCLFFLFST